MDPLRERPRTGNTLGLLFIRNGFLQRSYVELWNEDENVIQPLFHDPPGPALSALTRDHPETGRGWIMRSIRSA